MMNGCCSSSAVCDVTLPRRDGAVEPVFETRGAEARVIAGGEALIVYRCAEVACVDVCGHLPCVSVCAQESSDEFVHMYRFRARQFDGAIQRLRDCDFGQRGSNVIGHDGLHQRRWQPNRLPVGGRLGDGAHELEELCCADDRVGNRRCLDQIFLGHLCAEVAIGKKAIGADNRQRNVMSHAGGRFRGKKVAPRRLEERQDGPCPRMRANSPRRRRPKRRQALQPILRR